MGAIPIVCLFGLGIAVFLIAARINRPYLAKKAQEEQEVSDVPDTPDLPDAEMQQS